MPRSIDQQIPQWDQLKGSVQNYSFNMKPWADAVGEVMDTITASVLDDSSLVTIGAQTTTSGVWAAPITAVTTGSSIVELVGTTVSGNQKRHRRFTIDVTDIRVSQRANLRN